MHDSGLGYRRIAKRLRDMNIKTARGSVFKNNNVFAVIKRYEERQVRLREERNQKYEHKWGKMYLIFEREVAYSIDFDFTIFAMFKITVLLA